MDEIRSNGRFPGWSVYWLNKHHDEGATNLLNNCGPGLQYVNLSGSLISKNFAGVTKKWVQIANEGVDTDAYSGRGGGGGGWPEQKK